MGETFFIKKKQYFLRISCIIHCIYINCPFLLLPPALFIPSGIHDMFFCTYLYTFIESIYCCLYIDVLRTDHLTLDNLLGTLCLEAIYSPSPCSHWWLVILHLGVRAHGISLTNIAMLTAAGITQVLFRQLYSSDVMGPASLSYIQDIISQQATLSSSSYSLSTFYKRV